MSLNKKQKIYVFSGVGIALLAIGYFVYTKIKAKHDSGAELTNKSSDGNSDAGTSSDSDAGTVKPIPLSKIETTQVKIQPMQPLLNSGNTLKDKPVYAMYAGTNVYDLTGKKVRPTVKNEYLGKVVSSSKMPNGVYWVQYVSGSGKVYKMPSNGLLVQV